MNFEDGGEEKAVCNYCHAKLLGESKQGTSHLHKHFNICPQRTTRDIRQCLLKIEKQGKNKLLVDSYIFNQDASRMKLAKMIILHEYPLSMIDETVEANVQTTSNLNEI
ncbi:hypothetical protein Lal_00023593 [Lupinus albus]|nr:hypothetical protein Lal_00023593 [Lupinus albus]